MSQYPHYPGPQGQYPQYPGPPGYPPGYPLNYGWPGMGQPDPLAPYRRAAVLMFMIAGLFVCCGVFLAAMPWEATLTKAIQQNPNTKLPPGWSLRQIDTVMRGIGVVPILVGIVMIVMGAFVRKGSGAATLTSAIITGILVGFLLLFLLLGLIGGVAQGGGGTELFPGLCFMSVPGLLLGWQFIWLVQAYRSRQRVDLAQMQYQQQYWQYMQAQQAYGNATGNAYGNAGYRAHAPPPDPAAQPQSPYAPPLGQAPVPDPNPIGPLPPPGPVNPDSGESPLPGQPPTGDNPR